MREPTFSILISNRNEGRSLERTVASLLASVSEETFEIVVVDDASDDDSSGFFERLALEDERFHFERNDRQRGLIYTRARAVELSRGRLLCVLDAHCCLPSGWLRTLACELEEIDLRGIVVPRILPLDLVSWTIDKDAHGSGAATIVNPFLDFDWTDPTPLEGRLATATIPGGAWMCSRTWYNEIGGLDGGMRLWGGENIDVALRTWVIGGYCLVSPNVTIGHLFRPTDRTMLDERSRSLISVAAKSGGTGERSPQESISALAFNKIRAAHNAFSKSTMEKIILNLRHLPGFRAALDLIREDPGSLVRLKEHVESRRVRTDRWLIETFELPILEAPTFHKDRRSANDARPGRGRPRVAVVVVEENDPGACSETIRHVIETTGYSRYEILRVQHRERSAQVCERRGFAEAELSGVDSWLLETSRCRSLHWPSAAPQHSRLDDILRATDAHYVLFLDARARIRDCDWIERLILSFERFPRMILASPRVESTREEDEAIAGASLQVPAPHPGCVMARRKRLLELHASRIDAEEGGRLLMNLGYLAWQCGFEVRRIGEVGILLESSTESRSSESSSFENPPAPLLVKPENGRYDHEWLAYKFRLGRARTMNEPKPRRVQAEFEIRILLNSEVGSFSRALKLVGESGGAIRAHLLFRRSGSDESIVHVVCDKPEEAALSLRESGFQVELSVVVTALTDNTSHAVTHLVTTLETEGVPLAYSYSATDSDQLLFVVKTDDASSAEDVLRHLLDAGYPSEDRAPR